MDTDLERRVYNNYRAALTAQVGGMAADRRQRARQLTVERYNVPYTEVKRIVKSMDEAHGVTHEYGQDYLVHLKVEEAQAAFDASPAPCGCGSDEMVRVRPIPSSYAYGAEVVLTTMCFMCWAVKYD